jgi:hypothetical protein
VVPVGKVDVVYTHAVACGKVSRAVRNWQCSAYGGGGVVGRARDAAATTNAVLGVRPALHRLRSVTGNGLLRDDGADRHVAVPRGQRRVSGEQQQPKAAESSNILVVAAASVASQQRILLIPF